MLILFFQYPVRKGLGTLQRLQLQLAKNTRDYHCTFKESESLILLLDRVNGWRADNITLQTSHRRESSHIYDRKHLTENDKVAREAEKQLNRG